MIYTERKVSIKNDIATIDSPIILFRGDREVEIMFTIVDSKFKFQSNKGNVIDKTQAAFGQLAVALPDGTDLFTEIVETQNGVVVFSITGEMIDEIHEVGFYSFHIRLYNDDKTSRITLPPVMEGIEIREPLIIEGDVENTDLVGDATVGYSMVQAVGTDEEVFDEDGNYIPTVWGIGDKITAEKLNKIETGISEGALPAEVLDDINGVHHYTLAKRLDNIESDMLSSLDISPVIISNNKIDDSIFKNTEYRGNFVMDVNPGCVVSGSNYTLNIHFTDGTQVQSSNAVWYFVYEDGTESTNTCSVASYQQASGNCIGIRVRYVSDASTAYSGKIYDKIILNEGTNELTYDEFKIAYPSNAINEIHSSLSERLSEDEVFIDSINLFDFNGVTYGTELQPYNIVSNDSMCVTNYIPVSNGESIYVYPGIGGSQVANLYDTDKNKIGWLSLSTTANMQNIIESANVAYIRFNIPISYLSETFIVSKQKILANNIPIKIFNDTLNNPFNTNINTNWWYGKKGDSLGDSLTGQGWFQMYTSMYFNLDVFKNHGIGGSKLSGANISDDKPSMWQDERINALSSNADFITILGGQNDGDVEIGEMSKENMDTDTYVGALNTIIDKIYAKYNGKIVIILCTPFYVPSEGENSTRFKTLDEAVIEVGKLHGLPVADFGGMCGANKYVSDTYWDASDKTHPIASFYADRIAPILISTMEKIKPIDFNKLNAITYNNVQ